MCVSAIFSGVLAIVDEKATSSTKKKLSNDYC